MTGILINDPEGRVDMTKSNGRRLLRRLTAAVSILAISIAAGAAEAEDGEQKRIEITSQPLDAALLEIGRRYGAPIIAPEPITAGKTAPAIRGEMTAEEAINRTLEGTGLVVTTAANGAFVIAQATTASPIEVEDEIVVTGNREYLYRAEDATSFGFGIPQKDLPLTVNIVTEDFIRDAAALEIQDLIAYVPGVVGGVEGGGFGEGINIRGFENNVRLVNGSRQSLATARTLITTELLERVEIVKGPAGAEVGVADGGGLINYITKKPQREFAAEIFAGVGDFGYRRVGGDVTGPLTEDGRLRYRLIAAYTELQEWRAGRQDESPFWNIAPSLAWDYLDNGTITVEYTRFFSDRSRDRGVYYMEGAEFFTGPNNFAPREWSAGGGEGVEFNRIEGNRVDVNINQKLGSIFTLDVTGQHFGLEQRQNQFTFPVSFDAYLDDNLTWDGETRIVRNGNREDLNFIDQNSIRADLIADFEVGLLTNSVKVGYEFFRSNADFTGPNGVVREFNATLDLFRIDNSLDPSVLDDNNVRSSEERFSRFRDDISSFYGQWTANWNDKFQFIGGVRYDQFETFRANAVVPSDPNTLENTFETEFDAVSYRVAGSYAVTPAASLFAGYANSFNSQGGITRDGSFVDPLQNTSLEAGVKVELFGGGVLWTNTIYQITQDNIVAPDPDDLTDQFVIPFGEARVRGFESEFIGSITDYLDISAGASVQGSRNTRTENPELQNNEFVNVPNFSASGFVNYNFAQIGLTGASGRIGVTHVGERQGNERELFQLPAFTRVDLGARYVWDESLTFDFFVENVFDVTYFSGSDGFRTPPVIGVTPGDRRLFRFNASYRF